MLGYRDPGGIKTGMQITASPEHVVRDIGTKKMTALRKIVDGGREDYREYRSAHPVWASQDCGRTTHSLIHERMWQRAILLADEFEDVSYVESLPTRELYLGTQYRVRFKKHTPAGAVRSYPTATALDFFDEPPATLPSLQLVNLTVGYEWDEELRQMGRPVMSLHSAMDKALWMIELPDDGAAGNLGLLHAPLDGPTLPTIFVPGVAAEESEQG